MRIALAFLLAGCFGDSVTGLERSTPIDTPQLRQLWEATENCSGLTGDFESVHFYAAPGAITKNGEYEAGIWVRDGNRIYLSPPNREDWFIIMHEDMHALLQTGKHPEHYFNGVCGNLMSPVH